MNVLIQYEKIYMTISFNWMTTSAMPIRHDGACTFTCPKIDTTASKKFYNIIYHAYSSSWRTSVSWCGHPEKHPPKIVTIPNTDDFQQKIILLSPCHHEKAEGFCGDPELLRRKCLFFWIDTPATQVRYDGRIAENHRC